MLRTLNARSSASWAALGAVLMFVCESFADEPSPPEGFRSIFNGKDLNGWYGHNPHDTANTEAAKRSEAIAGFQKEFLAHWRVENGELVNDGNGPYATTKEEFGDIELLIDYKTVPQADSGIYLRGSPQIQIWDYTKQGGKSDLGADKGSGGLFNNGPKSPGKDPLLLADKPFGQWNRFRILQLGSRTTVFLNDMLVVDNAVMENLWDGARKRPLAARGPIHLQTHGGEIRWRNIFVREVPSDEANSRLRGDDVAQGFLPLFNGIDLTGWSGAVDDYEVREGAIVCKQGKGGELYTSEEYDDFVVRLEFELPPGGNNGLAIRSPGTGQPHLDAMCELQVLDDTAEMYAKLDPRQYHGSAYGMVPAYRGYLRPLGEWNYQEVTVVGPTIKVELNGSVVLDADLSQVTEFKDGAPHPGKDRMSGHFGFAGHSDPVMFRNVAVKPLKDPSAGEARVKKTVKKAPPEIYDTEADGKEQIDEALKLAKAKKKRVLLKFGANWCGWCHKLSKCFKTEPEIANVLKENYVLVLIDVDATEDEKQHNADVIERYGNPTRHGLPVLVVLDSDGKQLTTQDTGLLEEGDHHDPAKVLAFLEKWKPVEKAKKK